MTRNVPSTSKDRLHHDRITTDKNKKSKFPFPSPTKLVASHPGGLAAYQAHLHPLLSSTLLPTSQSDQLQVDIGNGSSYPPLSRHSQAKRMVTTEAGKAMVLTMRKGGDEAITQIDQGNDVGDG
jgi:hypothetical protein